MNEPLCLHFLLEPRKPAVALTAANVCRIVKTLGWTLTVTPESRGTFQATLENRSSGQRVAIQYVGQTAEHAILGAASCLKQHFPPEELRRFAEEATREALPFAP